MSVHNEQAAPDTATNILAGLVAQLTYKPGWRFALKNINRGQGCSGLTLMISAEVPNSLNPAEMSGFLHLMPVIPAAYDEENWTRWLLDQILLVEQHEALEYFQIGETRPFFPEHGPGRNPYNINLIGTKTREQAFAPAEPWTGQ